MKMSTMMIMKKTMMKATTKSILTSMARSNSSDWT